MQSVSDSSAFGTPALLSYERFYLMPTSQTVRHLCLMCVLHANVKSYARRKNTLLKKNSQIHQYQQLYFRGKNVFWRYNALKTFLNKVTGLLPKTLTKP